MVSPLVSGSSNLGWSTGQKNCVLLSDKTLKSHTQCLLIHRCINGYLRNLTLGDNSSMGLHPIQGQVQILLVALCYRNREKQGPDGLLGLHEDLNFNFQTVLFLQYSNVFIPTVKVNQLTQDKKPQEECLKHVGKKGQLEYSRPKREASAIKP